MAVTQNRAQDIGELQERLTETLPSVFYTCQRLLSNDNAAKAVCADVYKKVIKSHQKAPEDDSLCVWMKNLAAVACSSYLRKNDSEIFLKNPNPPSIKKVDVFHNRNLNTSATARYIENCIDRMPLPARFAAICYYYNGMTVAQTATVMDVPVIRVKELMRSAAAEFSALTKEFNDKRVTTTKIDIRALLDTMADGSPLPDINLSEILNTSSPAITDDTDRQSPTEPSTNASQKGFIISVCVLLAVVGVGLYIALEMFGKSVKIGTTPTISTPFASTSSEVDSAVLGADGLPNESEEASGLDTGVVSEFSSQPEEEKDILLPLYNITHETYYDASGDKIRECVYTYKNGKLSRVQTATPMFVEDLSYSWNKKGTKRITKDAEGNICETAWYDKQGNPTKLKYGDEKDETVKYKWTYDYTDEGYVKSAAFKGINSGKYTYDYDELGRVSKKAEKRGEDVYTATFTYDENGMVLSRVETDFDGSVTEYFYTYNYTFNTFSAAISGGGKIEGKISPTSPQS